MALIIQPGILGLTLWGFYRRRNRDRLAAEKIRKGAEREKFDDWMEKYRDGQDS